jgi:hypothetical protein
LIPPRGRIVVEASKKEIRIWAWGTSVILCLLGTVLYYRGHGAPIPYLVAIALGLALCALVKPSFLRPIYRGWLTATGAIGKFNTYVLLGIMFYLVFAPIGLVMRVLRIDLLHRKVDRSASSYWRTREAKPFCPEDYERQY